MMNDIFTKVRLFSLASTIFTGPEYLSNADWSTFYSLCDKWELNVNITGMERAMSIAIAKECNADDYFAYHGSNHGSLETGLAVLQKYL